jgi:hypothetical protein
MAVVTLAVQRAIPGQAGSPPPVTVAWFCKVMPEAGITVAAGTCTFTTKLTTALAARPAGTLQLTVLPLLPLAVHPLGTWVTTKGDGMLSAIEATAKVLAEPVFVSLRV